MQLKKAISGLLASVMVFSSIVSGIPVTVAGAERSETGGGADSGYYEVTHGKPVMVSMAKGLSQGGAAILGAKPEKDVYWKGEALKPFTMDDNDGNLETGEGSSRYFSKPQWLVVDLQNTCTEFENITLTYQANGWPIKGRIETGNDTLNWRTISEISRQSMATPDGRSITYTPPGGTGSFDRFVRFYFEEVNHNARAFKSVALQSVKIMGKPVGDPVRSVEATNMVLDKEEHTFHQIGETWKPVLTLSPANTTRKLIKWNSSNDDVVEVGDDGTITAKNIGTAFVTAVLAADESVRAQVKLNVTEDGKTNVLYGKTMTASHTLRDDLAAQYMTDGHVSEASRWGSGYKIWFNDEECQNPKNDMEVTLTADLEKNRTVFDAIKIRYFKMAYARTYTLETSQTGEDGTWYDIARIEKNETTSGRTVDVLTLNGIQVTNANGTPNNNVSKTKRSVLHNQLGRYMRLKITGRNSRSGSYEDGVSIKEIELIGKQDDEMPTRPVPVESFSLKDVPEGGIALKGKGQRGTVQAEVLPANATNPNIKWESSDPRVATVDETGTVTAVADGTATLTAESVSSPDLDKPTVNVSVDIPKITFDANGGVHADKESAKVVDVNQDQKAEKPADPSKSESTFDGWYDAQEGGTLVKFDDSGMSETSFSEDTHLYAHWKSDSGAPEEKKTVTFDLQGGKLGEDAQNLVAELNEDGTVNKPENPEKDGYGFENWYDAAENGQMIEFDADGVSKTVFSGGETLYAYWAKIDINNPELETGKNVRFYAGEGSFEGDWKEIRVELDADQKVTKPKDPVRKGYVFAGWYNAAEGEENAAEVKFGEDGKSEGAISISSGDYIRLYAHWTEIASTIEFDLAGDLELEVGETQEILATVDLVTASLDEIELKWSSSDPKAATVEPDAENSRMAVITAKAEGTTEISAMAGSTVKTIHVAVKKSAVSASVKVTFEAGEGAFADGGKTKVVTAAADGTVEAPEASREGYDFAGWYTDATAGEEIKFADGTAKFTESDTLYAHWTKQGGGDPEPPVETKVEVTFEAGEGAFADGGKTKVVTAAADGTVEAPEASREGYDFAGWYTDATAGEEIKFADGTAKFTESDTLYARWTKQGGGDPEPPVETKVEVTFEAGEGAFADGGKTKVVTAAADGTVEAPEASREGYDFAGWYTDATAGEEIKFADGTAKFAESDTLYAHWTKQDGGDPEPPVETKVEVTFEAGEGAFEDGKTKVVEAGEDKKVTKPADPKREGYDFDGWYDAQTDGNKVEFGEDGKSVLAFEEPKTLYAHWTKQGGGEDKPPVQTEIKVTFQANGGAFADASVTKEFAAGENGIVIKPADPARAGFVFAGWSVAPEGGSLVAFDANGAAAFTAAATLYAQWAQDVTILPPGNDPGPGATPQFKAGATAVVKNITYKVLNAGKKTAVVVKGHKNKKIKKVTIPATVKICGVKCKVVQIGKNAFKSYKKMNSITIGKYVTTIDKNAFSNCVKLSKITLKGKVLKTIKSGALKKTSKKLVVKVPKSMKKKAKSTLLKKLKKRGNKKVKVK